jgi:hypothetical protein
MVVNPSQELRPAVMVDKGTTYIKPEYIPPSAEEPRPHIRGQVGSSIRNSDIFESSNRRQTITGNEVADSKQRTQSDKSAAKQLKNWARTGDPAALTEWGISQIRNGRGASTRHTGLSALWAAAEKGYQPAIEQLNILGTTFKPEGMTLPKGFIREKSAVVTRSMNKVASDPNQQQK